MSVCYRWGVIGPYRYSGNDVITFSAARLSLGVCKSAESESSTPTPIASFFMSGTVLYLLLLSFQSEICIIGPTFRGFLGATLPFWLS